METKTIVQYLVAGVIVAGSLFAAYNAQDKINDQASEIKVLQNQVAALNDKVAENEELINKNKTCLLYTSPSPRDRTRSRMPSSA